jgi:hypothetical protein
VPRHDWGMPNPNGTPENLVASHAGNQSRLVHGLYSARRELDPRAAEIAEALLEAAPHTIALDWIGAQEIGALIVMMDRVDAALSDGRVENRRGQVRSLIDLRNRLSGRLERWLTQFGLTPAARAEWAARLAEGSLGAQIRQRLEAETVEAEQ